MKPEWTEAPNFGTVSGIGKRRRLSNSCRPSVPHVFIGGVEKKSCAKCGSLLPLSAFGKNSEARDLLNYHCLDCGRKRGKP